MKTEIEKATSRALDKQSTLDDTIKKIRSKLDIKGAPKKSIYWARDYPEPECIPSESFVINYLQGGGWWKGELHEIFGENAAGKSSLSQIFLKDCLRANPGGAVAYVDIEGKYNKLWPKRLGLDQDTNLLLIPLKILEDAADALCEAIEDGAICGAVWDSIGGTFTKRDALKFGEANQLMGGVSHPMKRVIDTVGNSATRWNIPVVFTNQTRDSFSMYQPAVPNTPGGQSVKFAMSQRLWIKRGNPKDDDRYFDGKVPTQSGLEEKIQVGYPLIMKVVKSMHSPAPRTMWSNFYFKESKWLDHIGFNDAEVYFQLGMLTGVAQRVGNTHTIGPIRAISRPKFLEALSSASPEVIAAIAEEIKDALAKGKMTTVPLEEDDLLPNPEEEEGTK